MKSNGEKMSESFKGIKVYIQNHIGIIQLNRPDVLNALSLSVMTETADTLDQFDRNPEIRCIITHGDKKAFAAGADIKVF